MLKGFKDFILRGNIIDLAVAVTIGVAFTAMVTAVNNALITPVVNTVLSLLGVSNPEGIGGTIDIAGGTIDIGAIVGAGITFIITAAAVYFIFVGPMNAAKEKFSNSSEDEVAKEVELLTEIRDLLKERGDAQAAGLDLSDELILTDRSPV